MGIPKKIHYCWFGRGEKSSLMKKCIATWKEFFPDYDVIEWNEDNYDLAKNTFAREAYERKKYAFVSDYVRADVLYHYGGIYFDTDIEVKKNFADLLKGDAVFCFETDTGIMTGFMAGRPLAACFCEIRNYYGNLHFVNPDGSFKMTPNPVYFTDMLEKRGLVKNGQIQQLKEHIWVYPNEVFCAFDMVDTCYHITEKTVAVHHYSGSWCGKGERFCACLKRRVSIALGKKRFAKIRRLKKRLLG